MFEASQLDELRSPLDSLRVLLVRIQRIHNFQAVKQLIGRLGVQDLRPTGGVLLN